MRRFEMRPVLRVTKRAIFMKKTMESHVESRILCLL